MEQTALERAMTSIESLYITIPKIVEHPREVAGSRYELYFDEQGNYAMRWLSPKN